MPTDQELKDLCDKCDWIRATTNDVNGYVVRGRGDYASASIFLPCGGHGGGTSIDGAGFFGYYWSSVPYSYKCSAWYLLFNPGAGDFSSGYRKMSNGSRYSGHSVRPVQGFAK